jgi:hypothetical protein
LEGKSKFSHPKEKKSSKERERAHDFENQEGGKQGRVQGLVKLKDAIYTSNESKFGS